MQRSKFAAVLFALSSTIFAPLASAVQVDDATDTLHAAGCAVTGLSPCSLRDAITFANTLANTIVTFNIPAAGVHTITPLTPLPAITNSTQIDGYTQPGAQFNTATLQNGTNAVLLIELDLTNNGGGGLVINGSNARVQGLVINRSPGLGITINGSSVEVHGNFIGTNPAGTAPGPGNASDGVAVGGNGDVIGGTGDAVRNLISGNGAAGVRVSGAGAVSALVGSNLIGTNAAGTAAVPNGAQGVVVIGQGHVVGGALGGNVISGNLSSGVLASSAIGNITIATNNIGANAAGTAPLGNGSDGITVNSNDVDIGGTDKASNGNVIGGNAGNGILVNGANLRIWNNDIGLLPPGGPNPNARAGISVQPFASDNQIGGFALGNSIGANTGNGVEVLGAGATGGIHNRISQNSIVQNGGLGIKLGSGAGPLPNDTGDADTGPNALQNYPLITSASVAAGVLTFAGTLNSNAGDDFTIEVFSNTACDASGNGEGQVILGTVDVTSDGSGNATFNGSFPLPPGMTVITATATDSQFNTSEFSPCFNVGAALPTITINDVSLAEGNSGTTNFVFTVTLSATANATVNFATADGTATAGSDYVANAGTVTFTSGGALTQTITVVVNGDTTVEPDETFFVNLSGAVGATIADNQGMGTIVNDDVATPQITINDVSQAEGNSGTTNFVFTVTLSATANATVNFATADGTATAGSDYVANAGTVTFTNGGSLTQTITVVVNGDTTVEPNETFFVNLSGAVGATIADNQGLGTIVNDDSAPTLAVNDASVVEGNTGTSNLVFTVSISSAPAGNVTVNYATADNTASAGSDYVATSGTLTFTPTGPLTQTVTVLVNGDTTVEGTETLFLNLSGAVGATILDAQGVGTIFDDDLPPPALIIPTLGAVQILVLIVLLGLAGALAYRRR